MDAPIRVLELRSVRGTGGGPEKTILAGTALADRARVRVTVCYLRDARDEVFGINRLARELPIEYIEVVERSSFDPAIWPALRRLVRDRRIDIVHAHDYKTNLLALLLSKVDGIIPLSTAHGYTGHSARERYVYYPADRRILARFPRVIAVSEDLRGALLACGARPERVVTILNGIDPGTWRRHPGQREAMRRALGLDPADVVVGAVGRVEAQKDFPALVRAVARIRATRPRVRLVMAGDGGERAAVEREAQACGLGEACLLLGHRTDIAALHHAFDLFVQSSIYEGTPNAVLEAMALETPLVATTAGGTAQIVTDGVHGLLVPPSDADALVSAIERALGDPQGCAARALAARRRVEHELSFERRTRTLETIYAALVHERAAGTRARADMQALDAARVPR